MRQVIAATRERTDRPFGVNVIIDEQGWATTDDDRQLLRDEVAAAADEAVAAIVLSWGDPRLYVAPAHEMGVELFIQVGSFEEAKLAAEAGVDAVIVQGIEAGGHVKSPPAHDVRAETTDCRPWKCRMCSTRRAATSTSPTR
jgi:NAD(P)H-dependent flavin oxidoreductase YrpB (nitropropane dioxygenase family)